MLDNWLRLGAALSMVGIALVFLGDALTINAGWRKQRRPRGLVWSKRGLVLSALALLSVAVFVSVSASGMM